MCKIAGGRGDFNDPMRMIPILCPLRYGCRHFSINYFLNYNFCYLNSTNVLFIIFLQNRKNPTKKKITLLVFSKYPNIEKWWRLFFLRINLLFFLSLTVFKIPIHVVPIWDTVYVCSGLEYIGKNTTKYASFL